MKVQYIQNACVVVEHGGTRVLCDPWLTDGAYYGSWCHYPPLVHAPEDFSDVDYVYISHIHPDHMDAESLKRLPKNIPILIHDFAAKFLYRSIEALGFETIVEVSHREEFQLADGFKMEILAADNCDPQVCYNFFGCGLDLPFNKSFYFDSLAVFNGGGKVVVNSNDCPYVLARPVCHYIMEKYGKVDFAMVGYGGAGPYPQCFGSYDDDEKLARAEDKKMHFYNQGVDLLAHLRPTAYMPFAGRYTLGGKLVGLNRFRGVPDLDDLPVEFAPLVENAEVLSIMVLLNSGSYYSVDDGASSALYIPEDPQKKEIYINTVLAAKKFTYEDDDVSLSDSLIDKLKESHLRLKANQEKYKYFSAWKIYLDAGQDWVYEVPFDGSDVDVVDRDKVNRDELSSPFARLVLDPRLLARALNRTAHWNSIEIGSHLTIFRDPDEYERGIFHFLSYLHP